MAVPPWQHAERPLVAVTTSEVRAASRTAISQGDPPRREMVLGLAYLEAIERAGGVPLVVPPLCSPQALDALLDRVDGLCLSGGPDLHPAAYGEEPHPLLGPTERHLDSLPVLAICRGAQVLNVARGGTLAQDLPEEVGNVVSHRQSAPTEQPTHPVDISPDCVLAGALGAGTIEVNSFHHQAVRRLGFGLVATARAPDGVIEAFESVDEPFVVAVQWHAEGLVGGPPHAALFEAFLAACRVGSRVTA